MGLAPIAIVIGLLIFQVDHLGYTGSQVYGVVCKVREAREASTHLGPRVQPDIIGLPGLASHSGQIQSACQLDTIQTRLRTPKL
jgi:hypothetical protein